MSQAVILLVSEDAAALDALAADLARRFGADYRIIGVGTAALAVAALAECAQRSEQVALLIADQRLGDGDTAVRLFSEARASSPATKRVLLIGRGNWSSEHPVIAAMALGQVDYHLYNPWHPLERILYPAVSEYLAAWDKTHDAPVVPLRIVGTTWSARSHEIRDFLSRASIPYWFYDAESEEGQSLLAESGAAPSRLPVLVFYTGLVLVEPSNADVVRALGMKSRPDRETCDVAVIGAGPAGLGAAVYAASEGLQTLILEPAVPGGQAGTSSMIRNYLGFQRGLSGDDLANRATEQAWLFGADFVLTQRVTGLSTRGPRRVVRTEDGSEVAARAVVLATGVSWRRLGVPELEALIGAGVFYGAAGAEARAMTGREVFVVGAGNSAGQAALHLAKYADCVTMLVRGDSLAKSMSAYLVVEIESNPSIRVRLQTEVVGGGGAGSLAHLVLRRRPSGATEAVPAAALFLMLGAEPGTDWLGSTLQRDDGGYLLTGSDVRDDAGAMGWPLERAPLLLETSLPGVFAAGDVRHRSIKRVASAVGEGATAVQLIHSYLSDPTC